ncbi:putative pentatricopeptide repeat-containing protein At5g43820 [Miscanthus floridulus]|uniref:putative pentatricopeptide repeat-containing protein At5g43820 n=1 Tax=Miscanthus floridulus TaxID=154761 RepID=UPI0034575049
MSVRLLRCSVPTNLDLELGKLFTERRHLLYVLIRCLFWRSRVGIASSLLHAAQKELLGLDKHVYNDAMGGWARFGSGDKLQEVWTKMEEDGLVPDEVSHCHLIEGLGRAGRIEDALRVSEDMVHERHGPTTMAYDALILNFLSVGDLDRCIKYYKDMLEKNCTPNIDTYSKMIKAFLKGRRVADVLHMFDDMLARGVLPNTGGDNIIYQSLVHIWTTSLKARHPLRRRYPLSEDAEPEPAPPPLMRSGAARRDLRGGAVPYTCSEENEGEEQQEHKASCYDLRGSPFRCPWPSAPAAPPVSPPFPTRCGASPLLPPHLVSLTFTLLLN